MTTRLLDPRFWAPIVVDAGTRCRIETPLRSPTNARVTRVTREKYVLKFFGIPADSEFGGQQEELLGSIDTDRTIGEIQITPWDGMILKWFHPDQGNGTFLTFPR